MFRSLFFSAFLDCFATPLCLNIWSSGGAKASPSIVFQEKEKLDESKLNDLARDKRWLKLLYYQADNKGWKSLVENKEFFLSKSGAFDPKTELVESIQIFATNANHPDLPQLAACVFPARWLLLRQLLSASWSKPQCSDFDLWLKNLPKEKLSLVYSSAYKGNPASIFGHTFLLFGYATGGSKIQNPSQLLGYSLAFLANPDPGDNSFMYVWKGLTGKYGGAFYLNSYYETINLYNNGESRDLWEYEIKLTPAQLEYGAAHLWEVMNTAQFRYYFLTKNCSYFMLIFLEAMSPDLEIAGNYTWSVIPTETVRSLMSSGKLSPSPTFRPSLRKQWEKNWGELNLPEREDVVGIVKDTTSLEQLSKGSLDNFLLWSLYQQHYRDDFNIQNHQKFLAALELRSKMEASGLKNISQYERRNQPDLGHKSSHLALSVGRATDSLFYGLRFNLGLNDSLANDLGFEKDGEVTYLNMGLYHTYQSQTLFLDKSVLASVTSLPTAKALDHRWSWRLGLEINKARATVNKQDLVADGNAGQSYQMGDLKLMLLAGVHSELPVASQSFVAARFGPSILVGILGRWEDVLAFKFQYHGFYNLDNISKKIWFDDFEIGQSLYATTNQELRLGYQLKSLDDADKNSHYFSAEISWLTWF